VINSVDGTEKAFELCGKALKGAGDAKGAGVAKGRKKTVYYEGKRGLSLRRT